MPDRADAARFNHRAKPRDYDQTQAPPPLAPIQTRTWSRQCDTCGKDLSDCGGYPNPTYFTHRAQPPAVDYDARPAPPASPHVAPGQTRLIYIAAAVGVVVIAALVLAL